MYMTQSSWSVVVFIPSGVVVRLEEKRFSLQRSVYRKDRTGGQLRNGFEEEEEKKTRFYVCITTILTFLNLAKAKLFSVAILLMEFTT